MLANATVAVWLSSGEGCLQAWFNKGNLERQGARYEEALHCYRTVLRAQPGHWRSELNSAVALIGLQRADEAQRALRRALELSGGAAFARQVG